MVNNVHTTTCNMRRSFSLSFHLNISIARVVVIAVRAESALENDAEIMPSTKQMPTIGDIMSDTINGMILSGVVGSAMPDCWV